MSLRAAWLLCGIVVVGCYGVLAVMTPAPPGTPELQITLPAPDLAPQLAALPGVWEAGQDGLAPSRVVVEQINETRATLLLIGPHHPPGYPKSGWERVRAQVHPDGRIEWGYPVRFTLRLAADGATLETTRDGAAAGTILKKVGDFARPSAPAPLAVLMVTQAAYQPGEIPGR